MTDRKSIPLNQERERFRQTEISKEREREVWYKMSEREDDQDEGER